MPKVGLYSWQISKKWALKLTILLSTFAILFLSLNANAQFIYNDCYSAADFGETKQDRFVIRPVGEICFQRCESECSAFSRRSGGVELNQGVIDKCNTTCRAGEYFSSTILEAIPNQSSPDQSVSSGEVFKTSSACARGSSSIASAGFNEYNTKIRVAPKQVIPASGSSKAVVTGGVRIKIIYPSSSEPNIIYMCGTNTTTIKPNPAFLKKSGWENSRFDKFRWHARNNRFYDTGIDVKDGDYLSIAYGGQYRSCSTNKCPLIPLDKGLFLKKPREPLGSVATLDKSLIFPAQKLKPLPPMKMDSDKDINEGAISYDDPESIQAYNATISFLGLQARSWETKTVFDLGVNLGDKDSAFNGDTTVYSRDTYYAFSGILQDFSPHYATVAIAHPDAVNSWEHHLGGYTVSITRKGCQFVNGQRLQYAIGAIDKGSDPKNPSYFAPSQWYDVTDQNLQYYEDIAVPVEGLLYLRIKPLPYESSATPQCSLSDESCRDSIARVKSLYTPANTGGQYYVLVEQDDVSAASNIVSQIVDVIRTYLFGMEGEKQGIVQFLFNKFVADSALVSTIRALLLLYIVYTGFSFVIGIAQFTQKEAVSRLIKIGIVIALISPDSWKFFNTYLFKLYTDGALELLVLLTAPPETSASQMNELLKNPTQIFSVFNEPFKLLFGKVTWIKVVALLFSGPIGIIVAMIIAVAAIIYAICIAKATLLYLLSLVGIATLLLMAPIFISFILFQFTKTMFDSWLKQLMSFAFQPIMVYVFIVVINYLILAALQVVLGFTACRACWFSLSLPGLDPTCIIPGYVSLFGVHNPDGIIGMPLPAIAAVFYFLILAQAMHAFTTFGAVLANMLIMSSYVGDLVGRLESVIRDTQTITSTIVGTDSGYIAGGDTVRGRVDWVGDKFEKARDTILGKKKDDTSNKKT